MSRVATLLATLALTAPLVGAAPADDRFRVANELARAADYPKAIAGYAELSHSGSESASLYWNWAQSAAASGAQGEALWAMLRARELDPGDRAVGREVERLRDALNLDRAEIAPEPLVAAGRFSRRFRLDLVAAALLLLSVLAQAVLLRRRAGGSGRALAPLAPRPRRPRRGSVRGRVVRAAHGRGGEARRLAVRGRLAHRLRDRHPARG